MRGMTMLLVAMLALAAPGLAAEGDTNFTNVVASGDISAGDDLTVTDDVTISGDLAVSGSQTHDGTQTFSADVTMSGNGVDLLFNAANQNTLGAATKGAKEIFARALTGETGTALTISAGSGVTISSAATHSADVTMSGNGTDILFNTANQNSIGAAATGAKEVFTRAVTGETGTALTISAGSGITISSATTHSAALVVNVSQNTTIGGRLSVGAGVAETVTTSAIDTITNALVELNDATNNLDCIDDTSIPDGALLIIRNPGGANTVTARDNQSCVAPQEPLQLGAATRAIVGSATLTVIRDATVDEFHEVAFAANN